MAAEPVRRTEPHKYLDASLVPLERALRARAGAIEQKSADLKQSRLADHSRILMEVATEFTALADELHHW